MDSEDVMCEIEEAKVKERKGVRNVKNVTKYVSDQQEKEQQPMRVSELERAGMLYMERRHF